MFKEEDAVENAGVFISHKTGIATFILQLNNLVDSVDLPSF